MSALEDATHAGGIFFEYDARHVYIISGKTNIIKDKGRMSMSLYLSIYIFGVIVSLAVFVYLSYCDWRDGYPITFGDIFVMLLFSMSFWIAVFVFVIARCWNLVVLKRDAKH